MVFLKKFLLFNKQKLDLSKNNDQDKLTKSINIKIIAVIGVILLIVVLIAIIVLLCISKMLEDTKKRDYWFPFENTESELGIYSSAAISTDAKNCAPIGTNILKKNGTAIDAAIAVLLCMGVVNPQSMGLGGGFLMTYYEKKSGKVHYINAREKAPLRATENMFEGNSSLAKRGGLSIAVPGELAGYEEVYKRFGGKFKWSELFQPSIDMCNSGIEVSKHLAKHLKNYKSTFKNETKWHFFINNATGDVYETGDKYFRPDLAKTLEIFARDGSQALYNRSHPLAQNFIKDLKKMGSIITSDDMEKYNVIIEESVKIKLRNNLTMYGAATPGSGALVGMMLNILDGYNITKDVVKDKDESILTLHRIIETFKFAYARRYQLEDNKTTMPAFIKNVTSKKYAAEIRQKINDEKTYHNLAYYGFNSSIKEDHGTASMVVIAPNGDAVVVTSTVNLYFGSLEISGSTGIIPNDEMDDFSLPDVISYFGVPTSPYNRIKPEKRPTSSMAPTIVIDSYGNVRLAISGNGGTKITSSIVEVAFRNLFLDENIKQSIDAPRFHHQLIPDYIQYEENYPKDTIDELIKKNHTFASSSGMSAIIIGIARGKDGKLYANSDDRKGGDVDGF